MLHEGYHPLRANGFSLHKLPKDIINQVKISVDEVQEDFSKATPFNKDLAGHIQREYKIQLSKDVTRYVIDSSIQYNRYNPRLLFRYNQTFKNKKSPENDIFYDGEAWVNFQKKYEYNPIHSHQGFLSYVIWYKIPYYKEDEDKYGIENNTRSDSNGGFLFVVPDEADTVLEFNLGIDKTMEGHMAIFPSNLMHMVYPFFSSEEYRITLSGNLFLNN